MKTKFYAKDTGNGGRFPEAKLIQADMGILIEHQDKRYTLKEDNYGRLILTSIGGVSLVLIPQASNCVLIESKD